MFVLARDMRAAPTPPGRVVRVPRRALPARAARVGLIGWTWIVAQGIAGGTSERRRVARCSCGSTAGSASRCCRRCSFPIWEWLDPFATLHDIVAWALRALGVHGWAISGSAGGCASGPPWSGSCSSSGSSSSRSPAAATLTIVLVGYTMLTLALMAQFGRDTWRAAGRDVHGLVPDAQPAGDLGVAPASRRPRRAASADDEDPDAVDAAASSAGRSQRPARRDLGDPAGRAGRPRHGVDHLRRPVADVAFASVFGNPALVPKTLLLLVFLWVIGARRWSSAGR